MEPIVYRNGIPCKAVKQGWKAKIWHSAGTPPPEGCKAPYGRSGGTGQRELVLSRRTVYVALTEEREPVAVADSLGRDFGVDVDLDALEQKALANRERSASRAKRNCRHKIKHAGFNSLLTGTYRENMEDFDRARRDFAAFLRKMRQVLPGFRAVYSFERQDRGAWHWHMACDRLPMLLQYKGVKVKSFDVARAVWRSVVGFNNGNVDVDGHRKRRKAHADQRKGSLAALAGYVSKYLTKDYGEGLYGRNMWGSTQGLTPPPAMVLELPECSLLDAIQCAFEVLPGHRIAVHRICRFGNSWVLYTEPDD